MNLKFVYPLNIDFFSKKLNLKYIFYITDRQDAGKENKFKIIMRRIAYNATGVCDAAGRQKRRYAF